MPGGRKALAISAGLGHTCAILDNSSVSCWGKNHKGQIGNGGNGPDDCGDEGCALLPVDDNISLPSWGGS